MTNAALALWIVTLLLAALPLPGIVALRAPHVRHPTTDCDKEAPGRVREAPVAVRLALGSVRCALSAGAQSGLQKDAGP